MFLSCLNIFGLWIDFKTIIRNKNIYQKNNYQAFLGVIHQPTPPLHKRGKFIHETMFNWKLKVENWKWRRKKYWQFTIYYFKSRLLIFETMFSAANYGYTIDRIVHQQSSLRFKVRSNPEVYASHGLLFRASGENSIKN